MTKKEHQGCTPMPETMSPSSSPNARSVSVNDIRVKLGDPHASQLDNEREDGEWVAVGRGDRAGDAAAPASIKLAAQAEAGVPDDIDVEVQMDVAVVGRHDRRVGEARVGG